MKRLLMCVAITLLCVIIPPLALAQGGKEVKGVVVDVMTAVGNLRTAYTQLVDLFAPVADRTESEAVEVFLAGYS